MAFRRVSLSTRRLQDSARGAPACLRPNPPRGVLHLRFQGINWSSASARIHITRSSIRVHTKKKIKVSKHSNTLLSIMHNRWNNILKVTLKPI